MKIATFYLSAGPGPGRFMFTLPDKSRVWIRATVGEFAGDTALTDALDIASPHKGEWLMNTHEVREAGSDKD